ncbi:MAG: PqqD family protein [Proteobacteria bacterium]|nr:PqqD family protein [Pseudomonadota bacterium]MBU1584868.1 PqqD family protein [Pseudomonadota bacterium]MBU2451882.1 PqqD family protein [Pseudomonadota bacterium]MBU2628758.1 PqqD family protein [Pseudomonadota bacterium]
MTVDLNTCYKALKDTVTKQIEDELLIVPLVSGIGDLDSEMFSLNKTAALVWERLDGITCLGDLIQDISKEFEIPYNTIQADVVDLVENLLKKGLVTAAS